jgi:hypothetical protein
MFPSGYFAPTFFAPRYFERGWQVVLDRLYAHRPILRRTIGRYNATDALIEMFSDQVDAEEEEILILAEVIFNGR